MTKTSGLPYCAGPLMDVPMRKVNRLSLRPLSFIGSASATIQDDSRKILRRLKCSFP